MATAGAAEGGAEAVEDSSSLERLADSIRLPLVAHGVAALWGVQRALLAPSASGRDALVRAPTGSGKTLGYLLPCAAAAATSAAASGKGPRALVLVPTRELAAQVHACAARLVPSLLPAALLVGGADAGAQADALNAGAVLAVGTPGRCKDLLEREVLVLEGVVVQVLDEADRLLDDGFEQDVEAILLPPGAAQTLMLSATLPPALKRLAGRRLRPDRLDVDLSGGTGGAVQHCALACRRGERTAAVLEARRTYAGAAKAQTLAFVATKADCDELAGAVAHRAAEGGGEALRVRALHGDLAQAERDAALSAFRAAEVDVLVATDVAARGLDVAGIALVVHCALPGNADTYSHRAGRAGRHGCASDGVSLVLYAPEETEKLRDLEAATGVSLRRVALLGDAEKATAVRTPAAQRERARDGERLLVTGHMAELAADLEALGEPLGGGGKKGGKKGKT